LIGIVIRNNGAAFINAKAMIGYECVRPGAAFAGIVGGKPQFVIAIPANQNIRTIRIGIGLVADGCLTGFEPAQRIVARAAIDRILPVKTDDLIVPLIAQKNVVAIKPVDRVIATAAR